MQNKWEEAKTPTPTHPIPLDTQMYIQELESRFDRIVEQLEEIYDRNDKWKKEYYEEQDWEYFDRYSNRNIGIYEAIEIVKGGVDNDSDR